MIELTSILPFLGGRVACSVSGNLSIGCTNLSPVGGTTLFISCIEKKNFFVSMTVDFRTVDACN